MNKIATPNQTSQRLAWLWLLIGAALLPWITTQTVIPIAAWLAPIFLLRFTRTQRAAIGLPLVVLVNIGAQFVASRNGIIPGPSGLELYIILASMGLIVSLSYIVDRLLAPRLTGLARTLVFPCSAVAVDLLMDTVSPFGLFGTPTCHCCNCFL
jgi:apolipoprotein N-acyltransferase